MRYTKLLGCLAFVLLAICVAGIATAQAPAGIPSKPRFQSAGVGTSAPVTAGTMSIGSSAWVQAISANNGALSVQGTSQANLFLREDDAPADEKIWRLVASAGNLSLSTIDDAQSGSATPLLIGRTGTVVDSIALNATAVTVNASAVCTANGTNCPIAETSGTFVASFDTGCTTTPTITFAYVKVGSLVTIAGKATSGFPCTGDSTAFATTGAPVPAAIRPTVSSMGGAVLGQPCLNNAAVMQCQFALTSTGNVQFNRADGTVSWTAAGNRSATTNGNVMISYYLLDP